MVNCKYPPTPWLQDALAEFKKYPTKQKLKEMLESPFPEKIKDALRRLTIVVPRKRYRERQRNY